jgi:RNA polymerase sigma factor (sigma-70 family)
MTPPPDQQLPADAEWLRALLQRLERPLILYAMRLLGDVEGARDAVQESFLRLCSQDRESLGDKVDVWLFTVCRNICTDVHRRESRTTTLEDGMIQDTEDALATPVETAEVRDEYSHVMQTITSLPLKQQEVLKLKFQDGLSYVEISRITKDSIGNVGWLLHTGLKGLREKLDTSEIRGAKA